MDLPHPLLPPVCILHHSQEVLLLLWRVFPPGLVQYSSQHSCVIAINFFSPYDQLGSMWCIYIAVLTRPLLGKNCVLFYWSGWTSISSLSCRTASIDLPHPLLPPICILHHSREVLQATSHIGAELL